MLAESEVRKIWEFCEGESRERNDQPNAVVEFCDQKFKVRPGSKDVGLSPATCLDAGGRKELER